MSRESRAYPSLKVNQPTDIHLVIQLLQSFRALHQAPIYTACSELLLDSENNQLLQF